MKPTALNLILATLMSFALLSCSKDDNGKDNENGNPFANVPSGKIVPVAKRASVLTGTENANPKSSRVASQKWWKHKLSVIDFSDNCGVEDEKVTSNDVYFGFYPTGEIYVKNGENGSPVNSGKTWSWVDSSTKDKIFFQGVEFTFTELWDLRFWRGRDSGLRSGVHAGDQKVQRIS